MGASSYASSRPRLPDRILGHEKRLRPFLYRLMVPMQRLGRVEHPEAAEQLDRLQHPALRADVEGVGRELVEGCVMICRGEVHARTLG